MFRTASGTRVVVLQSDLLEAMRTRVVAPLLPPAEAGPPLPGLTVDLELAGEPLRLMPQLMATLTLGELGARLGSLAPGRDAIIRACDVLLLGDMR